ncbi:MAG TPA: TetR/AcrR family transcriptional regulator [Gemmatimonadales bacterium]|nr:TetR/AcrR family transcriptional regulator [Gemmatimonadales bacterium]
MRKVRKTLEPRQERSRESLRKLLKAAAEVLGQHGVEGTTIPRIAHHAGLTPGAVYRRFHDKDALLETAILGILDRQDERLRTGLTEAAAAQIPLPVLAEQTIGGMVTVYRMNAPLLRAMRRFVHGRIKTPFWAKATRLEARAFNRLADLFLTHRDEIRHPDPRVAVSLGMMMVVSTIYDLVVTPLDPQAWKELLPRDDQALKRELTRAFLRYLGAGDGPEITGRRKGTGRSRT